MGFWYLSQFDFNSYIPQIQKFAKEKWGHDVSLKEIKFTLKEGLAIQGKGLDWRIPGRINYSAQLDELYLRFKILPLVIGRLEIAKVIFINPSLTIERPKESSKPTASAAPPAVFIQPPKTEKTPKISSVLTPDQGIEKPAPVPAVTPAALIRNIDLKAVKIENGKINILDNAGPEPKTFHFDFINIKANYISLTRPFEIKGSFQLDAIPVDLNGLIGPLGEEVSRQSVRLYRLEKMPFSFELSAENFSFPVLKKIFPELRDESLDLKVSGSETLNIKAEGTPYDFKVQLFQSGQQQKIQIGNFFEKKSGAPLELTVAANLEDQKKLTIDRALLELDQLTLRGSGEIFTVGQPIGNLNLNLKPYSLSLLKNLFPDAAKWNLKGSLNSEVETKKFNFETKKGYLKGKVNIENFYAKPDSFKTPLTADEFSILIREEKLILDSSPFQWGDGKIFLEGQVRNYWDAPELDLKGKIKKVDLDAALREPDANEISLDGLLSGFLVLSGKRQIKKSFSEVLNGEFELQIENGSIENFNIIDTISRQTSGLPGVGTALEKALQKRFPRLSGSNDTDFERTRLEGHILDGIVNVVQFLVETPEFDIIGNGRYSLRKQIADFSGKVIFSLESTDAIVHMVNELEALKDQSGRLVFSFTARGIGKKTQVSIIKEFIQDAFQRILINKGIELIFGKEKSRETREEKSVEKVSESEKRPRPERAPSQERDAIDTLIQFGLDQLLKQKK